MVPALVVVVLTATFTYASEKPLHEVVTDVPTPKVKEWESGFYRFLDTEHPNILKTLGETKNLTDDLRDELDAAIESYRQTFSA